MEAFALVFYGMDPQHPSTALRRRFKCILLIEEASKTSLPPRPFPARLQIAKLLQTLRGQPTVNVSATQSVALSVVAIEEDARHIKIEEEWE